MSRLSSRGAAWERLRLRVLERDSYICAYCGNEADTADHIVAKDNGGTDEMSNLVAACNPCNGRKGARVIVRLAYRHADWLDRL